MHDESFCCIPENKTTLQINYISILKMDKRLLAAQKWVKLSFNTYFLKKELKT